MRGRQGGNPPRWSERATESHEQAPPKTNRYNTSAGGVESAEHAEDVSLWDGGAAASCGVPAGPEAGGSTGVVPPLTPRARRGVRTGAFSQTSQVIYCCIR